MSDSGNTSLAGSLTPEIDAEVNDLHEIREKLESLVTEKVEEATHKRASSRSSHRSSKSSSKSSSSSSSRHSSSSSSSSSSVSTDSHNTNKNEPLTDDEVFNEPVPSDKEIEVTKVTPVQERDPTPNEPDKEIVVDNEVSSAAPEISVLLEEESTISEKESVVAENEDPPNDIQCEEQNENATTDVIESKENSELQRSFASDIGLQSSKDKMELNNIETSKSLITTQTNEDGLSIISQNQYSKVSQDSSGDNSIYLTNISYTNESVATSNGSETADNNKRTVITQNEITNVNKVSKTYIEESTTITTSIVSHQSTHIYNQIESTSSEQERAKLSELQVHNSDGLQVNTDYNIINISRSNSVIVNGEQAPVDSVSSAANIETSDNENIINLQNNSSSKQEVTFQEHVVSSTQHYYKNEVDSITGNSTVSEHSDDLRQEKNIFITLKHEYFIEQSTEIWLKLSPVRILLIGKTAKSITAMLLDIDKTAVKTDSCYTGYIVMDTLNGANQSVSMQLVTVDVDSDNETNYQKIVETFLPNCALLDVTDSKISSYVEVLILLAAHKIDIRFCCTRSPKLDAKDAESDVEMQNSVQFQHSAAEQYLLSNNAEVKSVFRRLLAELTVAGDGMVGTNCLKYKIAVVGSKGSGKTQLINRFVSDQFCEASNTTSVNRFKLVTSQLPGKTIRFEFIEVPHTTDCFGLFRLHNDIDCVIVLVDGTSDNLNDAISSANSEWLHKMENLGKGNVISRICVSKADIANSVSTETVHACDTWLISSKTGLNIDDVFKWGHCSKKRYQAYTSQILSSLPEHACISHNIKCVIWGPQKVGKTNIMLRIASRSFNVEYVPTVGVDFLSLKAKDRDGRYFRLQVWDTSGDERFRAITASYIKETAFFIVVFSLDDKSSLTSLDSSFMPMIRSELSNSVLEEKVIICANKYDSATCRKVNDMEIDAFMEKHGLSYDNLFFTSALTGYNIRPTFQRIVDVFSETICDECGRRQTLAAPVARNTSCTCILL